MQIEKLFGEFFIDNGFVRKINKQNIKFFFNT